MLGTLILKTVTQASKYDVSMSFLRRFYQRKRLGRQRGGRRRQRKRERER